MYCVPKHPAALKLRNTVQTSDDAHDTAELIATVNQVMPFGRFKGSRLIELPEPYLVWFAREGFPSGILGRRMMLMHEIKVNGLETMLKPLVGKNADDVSPQTPPEFDA